MYSQVTNTEKTSELTPTDIYDHFSRIANNYRQLRTTDSEPIAFIAKELRGLTRVEAVDIGCGEGRYDLLLFNYLGDKLRLACVDANHGMLEVLDAYLKRHGISNFVAIKSGAESLPFPDGALNCVCTFNAVHHFNLLGFLRESARILKSDGYLFIYTRLYEQNRSHIWGRYFPEFHQKENRLHSSNTFLRTVAVVPTLRIESIEYFKYGRVSTLEQLIERTRARHYSTFLLYSPKELEEAITKFAQNIERRFKDVHRVSWFDEYALFIVRKRVDLSPLS